MLNIIRFFMLACLILGMGPLNAAAQTGSQDADDWDELRGRRNIFAVRDALDADLPVSDAVRALGQAYIGAFSHDFQTAHQALGYASNYAQVRGDGAFAAEVDRVAQILMRQQGRYQALANHLSRGPENGTVQHQMVMYKADLYTSAYIGAGEFTLENISPDDARIVVGANFNGTPGTVLFDTGAETSLLSDQYAEDYSAQPSGVYFNMLTVDGPRYTQLASLNSLEIGAAKFGGVPLGVQTQKEGVIGFFLNEGATGILGFPLISRLGEMEFQVEGTRVERVLVRRQEGKRQSKTRPNMMIRDDKPYIRVTVDGAVYSCIFDTGAPRSLFSREIIARHSGALGLEMLTRRQARAAGLHTGKGAGVRYVKSVPARAGYHELDLQNVQTLEAGGPASDFCLIGLDAVISSGGARMDMQALQIYFGENKYLTSTAFNLR